MKNPNNSKFAYIFVLNLFSKHFFKMLHFWYQYLYCWKKFVCGHLGTFCKVWMSSYTQKTNHFLTFCKKLKHLFWNIYQSQFESHKVLKIQGPMQWYSPERSNEYLSTGHLSYKYVHTLDTAIELAVLYPYPGQYSQATRAREGGEGVCLLFSGSYADPPPPPPHPRSALVRRWGGREAPPTLFSAPVTF